MKLKLLLVFFLLLFSQTSFAYVLPEIHLSENDLKVPAEQHYQKLLQQKNVLEHTLPLSKYKEHKRNPKLLLSSKEREVAVKYASLLPLIDFWTYVFNFKQDLLDLYETKDASLKNEADLLAKETILSLYQSSQEFKILTWPLLHNTYIKLSKNTRGYCYHYVENLKRDLGKNAWNFFTLSWVEAYSGKYREHNTLAISKKGDGIEHSIIVDGWRKGSKPFWIQRKDDHYPWQLYQVLNKHPRTGNSNTTAAPLKALKSEAP